MTNYAELIAEAEEAADRLEKRWPKLPPTLVRRLATAMRELAPPEGWRIVYVKGDAEVWEESQGKGWVGTDPARHLDIGAFPTASAAMAALDGRDKT